MRNSLAPFRLSKIPAFPNIDKYSLAHETIINLKCVVLYWLRKGPRKSQLHRQKLFRVFCSPKFLRVSYFYVRAGTHEAIVHCEIDLASCTTGLYFPHCSTFLIRSQIPWGARETLLRFSSHYSIICMFLPDAP